LQSPLSIKDIYMAKQEREKGICHICKKEFPLDELYPSDLLRDSLTLIIREEFPDWNESSFICLTDLRYYRSEQIEDLLKEEIGDLSRLEEEVLDSFQEHEIFAENLNKEFEKEMTFPEKNADLLARFAGSWSFIGSFSALIVIWIIINTIGIMHQIFDPYPFILLNLFLSCLAAIQAPVIMMSQNRQAKKEKLRTDYEYGVNLKAELEIRQLHSKLDQFMKKQWHRMMEMQRIQIDLAEQISEKITKNHKKP